MAQTGYTATGGEITSTIVNGILYRIHTFTSGDAFVPASNFDVEYLVVGGGGGGGCDMGGGGGAGGYLAGILSATAQNYPIIVGAGGIGAGPGSGLPSGSNGTNSSALGFTSFGGGGGASNHNISNYPAGNGGSGGGGSGGRASSANFGGTNGTGTTGQGYNGAPSGVTWNPGGGGGAGAAGSNTPGNGGIGVQNDILGINYYWAGGGGGAGYSTQGGNGGLGGGGGGPGAGLGNNNGINPSQNAGGAAAAGASNLPGGNGGLNTGGGGGGGAHYNSNNKGGNGGSGIVVVRYILDDDPLVTSMNASPTSIAFGESVTVSMTGAGVDGTNIPYTISGVTSAEINNASLTGNFTLTSGGATLQVNTTAGASFAYQVFTITSEGFVVNVTMCALASNTQPSQSIGDQVLTGAMESENILSDFTLISIPLNNISIDGVIVKSTFGLKSGAIEAKNILSEFKPISIPLDRYALWFSNFSSGGASSELVTRQILIR